MKRRSNARGRLASYEVSSALGLKTISESAMYNIGVAKNLTDAVEFNAGVQALHNDQYEQPGWSSKQKYGFDRASQVFDEPEGGKKIGVFAVASQEALAARADPVASA